jgi:hypothetical protein
MSRKRRVKRPSQPASCGAKRKHTEHEAKGVARYLWTQHAKLVRAYRCLYCHLPDGSHAWHIGHQ